MSNNDAFGMALYDYYYGNKDSPLYFVYTDKKVKRNLHRYFRNGSQFSDLEKRLFEEARGEVLDIGCSTGYYIPFFRNANKVTGIDSSEYAIKLSYKNGVKGCKVANIFNYNPQKKFDTITLLENNLGIGGDLDGVRRLVGKIQGLLDENGKVLIIQKNIRPRYKIYQVKQLYKGFTNEFKWIHLRLDLIKELFNDFGFTVDILDKNKRSQYLLEAKCIN